MLRKALGMMHKPSFSKLVPDFAKVGLSKEKPADFETRQILPDGRQRLIIKESLLQECDTLILIDDSASMYGEYWNMVSSELALVTDVLIQNDPDGIDLFFLNHKSTEGANPDDGRAATGYLKIQNPDYILNKFSKISPSGGTPTPARLGLILEAYVSLCERLHNQDGSRPRPLNIIVWTDGDCDMKTLQQVIINAARRLDAINAPGNQCGIQFFQVGNEPGVEPWLKELDDNLQGKAGLTRDMVDTKKYSDITNAGGFNAKNLVTIMLGALSKRHDRK